jgi:carboxyl-terminal processing protease
MNKKRGVRLALFGLVTIIGFGFLVSLTNPTNRYFEIVKNLDIFATLYKEVNEYYVDEVNPAQLMNKGVEKMLSDLDPYTSYISEDQIESFRTMNTGQYAGIGAATVTIDGRIYVSMVYEGFSAFENGLRIGDEIIAVNGTELKGLDRERINEMVKGQAKTVINLTVKDVIGETTKNVSFEREKVTIPNVPYAGMLPEQIGYIKFTEFTPNGYKNIKKELQKLLKQGATGIVLDLRGNLGGLLKEAVDISNLFLESDLDVVYTRGKVKANSMTYKTGYNPVDLDIPLAILVDNRSASASEIVAGTLQDYDRAVLIGQKTYGKGLVQNTRDLPYNSKVKMTIAKYYIPSGRCIQAVDYSHRNADGSIGKIPDSLKVAFKTRNGRTVYDGGGIDPEVKLEPNMVSAVTQQLVMEGYIFRFANEYKKDHPAIPPARDFNLSDTEYLAFIQWVDEQGFSFKNSLMSDIKVLRSKIEKEGAKELLEAHIENIEKQLNKPVQELLEAHSSEIKNYLEREIAARYYFEAGTVEASLGDDLSVAKAIEILKDSKKYNEILAPGV